MSTVIMVRLDGVTPAEYDSLRNLVEWDRNVPAGMQMHLASFDGDILRISEVWDSSDQYDAYARDRVNPALAQLGMTVEPQKIVSPAHCFFARQ
jgi:hypothetical protein